MSKTPPLVLLAALGLAACQQGDPTLQEQLATTEKRVASLAAKIDRLPAGGAAAAAVRPQQPQPQQPPAPDPSAVYAVPIDDAPVRGPANARVTIVEGADFACPFCRMAEGTMDEIAKAYPKDVRFVFRHFVVHPQVATLPALATCAAQKQGKFWEMKKAIWDSAWEAEPRPRMKSAELLGQANMEKLAQELGLKIDQFKTDMQGKPCRDQLETALAALTRIGVDGTPAFYVNGRPISGAQPFDSFKRVIDEELKKADDAIRSGAARPDDYYQKFVVEKGRKG